MARGLVRRQNLTHDTLLTIATIGVLTFAASTSPFFLHALVRHYFLEKNKQRIRARARKLRELEKKKIIDIRELKDGSVRVKLTRYGQKIVHQYKLDEMRLPKLAHWDGKWRIVIYDIPTSQRRASTAFQQKFRQLGLYPLQRSVWVYPYECEAEIEFLASVFEIDWNQCICYFLAHTLPGEREIKKHFALE